MKNAYLPGDVSRYYSNLTAFGLGIGSLTEEKG